MIALLRGALAAKQPHQVIVDVGGVGYEVWIPVSTFTAIPDIGGAVTLQIYTNVREDAIQLFGFKTLDEKHLFEKLISVNGVGPKLAITALSGLAPSDLVSSIKTGDLTKLTKIPGVGKKTAERMILELRDKLDLLPVAANSATARAAASATWSANELDVISALINLGSQRSAAEDAVQKAKAAVGSDGFELLFRKALDLVRK
jgi:holliday junction DNA helicase RuvA